MAATVTIQKIHDGISRVVQKITIAGDAGGDVSPADNSYLASPATFTPAATRVRIDRIQSTLAGFWATLYWDATTDVMILDLPADTDVDKDYSVFGGLTPTGAAGQTGRIQLTTSGLTSNKTGHIILHMTKKQ